MNTRPSTIVLLGVNIVPVAGVLFLDWRVFDVLMLYWAENVVIGVINVFRMAVAKGNSGAGDVGAETALRAAIAAAPEKWKTAPEQVRKEVRRDVRRGVRREGKSFLIPFFILHYGVFCTVHLVFLSSLFRTSDIVPGFISTFGYDYVPLLIGIVPIAASHLYSFFSNFIGKGEYLHATPKEIMHRPYGRIIALHVVILAGGALVHWIGGQVYLLVILVVVKTLVDAKFHTSERDRLAHAGAGIRQ